MDGTREKDNENKAEQSITVYTIVVVRFNISHYIGNW